MRMVCPRSVPDCVFAPATLKAKKVNCRLGSRVSEPDRREICPYDAKVSPEVY